MASGLRARASETRAIQARWREGKSKRRVTSKDSLFHHHHPNFYDFFPRAIAPFTGIYIPIYQYITKIRGWDVFSIVFKKMENFSLNVFINIVFIKNKAIAISRVLS